MKKISAAIITYNEEKNIERCITSLNGIADEIVVVDSNSTDKTKEICTKHRVFFYSRPFTNYSDQKNWAVGQCQYDIILSVDADEALDDKLKTQIASVKNNWQADAYSFNRMTNYCGKWIKHTGWYPDKQVRLWDKSKARWEGIIHEKLTVDKKRIIHLSGNLLHYSFYTVEQHIAQINRFSTLRANDMFANGKKFSWLKVFIKPRVKFFKHFILKGGFRDGYSGYVIAKNSAHAVFLKYIKLKYLKNNAANNQ